MNVQPILQKGYRNGIEGHFRSLTVQVGCNQRNNGKIYVVKNTGFTTALFLPTAAISSQEHKVSVMAEEGVLWRQV
ncbi:MAG: hypothetical protein ACE5IW_02270, partial [bacterium]